MKVWAIRCDACEEQMNIQKKKKIRKEKDTEIKDILMRQKPSRRMLPDVPVNFALRKVSDRRGENRAAVLKPIAPSKSLTVHDGLRYEATFSVRVTCWLADRKKVTFDTESADISTTGTLLIVKDSQEKRWVQSAQKLQLRFRVLPGMMPEGYESRVRIHATVARVQDLDSGGAYIGLLFKPSLAEYIYKRRSASLRYVSIFMLVALVLSIGFMRVESILYFRFNRFTYFYSIAAAVFLVSRYLFGALYKAVPINREYTPGVTVIIPCFNEVEWIQRTVVSCVNQDYPIESLEVIVVDDCSNDGSYDKVKEIVHKLWEQDELYKTRSRLRYIRQPQNAGKRYAMSAGTKLAKHDLVLFVDSDSFLDPQAVRNMVQPFQDPKMGGVSGRTDVANTYTNMLTKMQSVRYYIAFRVIKAAESYFDAVTCLSGPISCYKKSIVMEHMDEWLNQSFLGQKATFGDDRAMTNFVLRHHRTVYQDSAICSTIVPNKQKQFLKQQIRWKRSWLRESMIAASYMWKKEPFMALFYYMGFIIPLISPIILLYNLVYIPATRGIFPISFLMGLLAAALLMSAAQLFYRRSSIWAYGIVFSVYYVFVLLWQMPYAWVTFWKSTWGTRMTPEDILEGEKKATFRKKWRSRLRGEPKQKEKRKQT